MEPTLYGLYKGQCRDVRRVNNAAWFDQNGRMIGWGDLTDDDLVRIAKEIPFGALFIVINPPISDLTQCSWLIEHGSIYAIVEQPTAAVERKQGVRSKQIDRPTAQAIVQRIGRLNNR